MNPAANPLDLLPGISFGGIVGTGALNYDGRFPYDPTRDNAGFAGSIGKVWGGHTFKAGASYQFIAQYDSTWANNFTGRFDFSRNGNNPLDTNHPFANAALGLFSNYIEATSRPISDIRAKGLEWYVQESPDVALFKNIPIQERLKLQFRAEFYNAFNHTRFSAYDAAARFDAQGRQVNTRFGQFTAARTPRIAQFALRVSF